MKMSRRRFDYSLPSAVELMSCVSMISGLFFICVTNVTAATLYAATFANDLYVIDTDINSVSLVGSMDRFAQTFGLADYNGQLWGYDQTNYALFQLDTSDASTIQAISTGLPIRGEGALAIDGSGNGYLGIGGTDSYEIQSFDLTAEDGALTWVASIYDVLGLDGMDFDSSNTLYAISQSYAGQTPTTPYSLFTIDTATAIPTMIGSTGISDTGMEPIAGLTFDSAGTLWGMLDDDLYTIDINTGVATFYMETGLVDVSGLSAITSPVPLPQTVWLFGSGLLGLIGIARRKKDI